MVPRDFDMESPNPFQSSDIVSLVPVHKVMTGHKNIRSILAFSIRVSVLSVCIFCNINVFSVSSSKLHALRQMVGNY